MYYHLILSEKCNLECRYCYKKSLEEFDNGLDKKFKFDFSDPMDSEVKISELKKFLEKDNDAVLVFYGGEPLLQISKIKKIIDEISVPFRMQTNGILLDKLESKYLNKIGKILVSLDGDSTRTNKNRGSGKYEKILENIKLIRKNGYKGEIVARMTIAQDCSDLFPQVMHLVSLIDEKLIDSVHWQIDCGFYKFDFEEDKIKKFFEEYNKSVEKLINWWGENIRKGKVYRLYPFVGIVKPILEGKTNCGLRCGAGHSGYAITTSGKLVHCPIMNSIENFKAGNLKTKPCELKKFDCKTECKDCEFYGLCGGRCMYWRCAKLWPKVGDEMICNSIKNYINLIKEKIPEIKELIEKKIIKKEYFDYEDYFGPEIIP